MIVSYHFIIIYNSTYREMSRIMGFDEYLFGKPFLSPFGGIPG